MLQKRNGRVSGEELFARLIIYDVPILRGSEREIRLMPIGCLPHLWECCKQFKSIAKPKREWFTDGVILFGI